MGNTEIEDEAVTWRGITARYTPGERAELSALRRAGWDVDALWHMHLFRAHDPGCTLAEAAMVALLDAARCG